MKLGGLPNTSIASSVSSANWRKDFFLGLVWTFLVPGLEEVYKL